MKLNSLVWTVIVVFLLTCSSSNAQLQPPYFVDDFEDGNAEDNNPVTWQLAAPYDTGTAEVINGEYVLTPPNTATPLPGALNWSEVDSVVAGPDFREVSVYTQLRVLGSGNEYAGVFARGTYAPTGEARARP